MKENEIKLLKEQLEKIYKLPKASFGLKTSGIKGWISGTISIIERIYGKESLKIEQLRNIEEIEQYNLTGENYYEFDDFFQMAESIVQSFIDELENLGIPSKVYDGKDNGINLTMVQNQSNTQTVDINIVFDALNDELTGTQRREIQSIIESKEDLKSKKGKLLNTLKDFGIDAVSKIMTNILTNMIQ